MTRKFGFVSLVILLLFGASACAAADASISFDERILLYYVGDEHEKGIYQVSSGHTEPELIIGDLPIDDSSWASVSPDGQFVFFPTKDDDVIVNLSTMEVHTFPASLDTNFEHYAAFSPDNSYLAIIRTSEDNLILIDLNHFDWSADPRHELVENWIELVEGRCLSYEVCGSVCYSMRFPFWVGSDQLLFFHNSYIFTYYGATAVSNCEPQGEINSLSSVILNGTIKNTVEFDSERMDFWLNPVSGQIHYGPVLITYPFVIDDDLPELVWWDTEELSQGIMNPHPLIDTENNLFSLSPDGKILRYNRGWEIVNLFTDEVVKISSQPKNIEMLVRCDWHPSNGNIICKGFTKSEEFVLMLFSETLQAGNILQEIDRGWYLIGFYPE